MDFEITRREVMFSVAIVCVLLIIGMAISAGIDAALQERYQAYNTALQIEDDPELFAYGMRTSVGNAFAHGELRAVDPVSIPDIPGDYAYIRKVKERHTMHTRVVTYTDGKGHVHTRTEHYWTWDEVKRWEWHCGQISFLGHTFPYEAIPLPGPRYLDTLYESGSIRYVYHCCEISYTGTLWARLADGDIADTAFYDGMTIEDTLGRLESNWQIKLFWVTWVLFIAAAVFCFYYIDNRWLE